MPLLDGGRASGLFFFMLLLPLQVSAQLPSQITIEWVSPPSCPRSLVLETDLERLLGPQPQLEPTTFKVRVVELRAVGYRLTLDVESEKGHAHRQVRLTTCTDVQEAAAALIATAIDPQLGLGPQALEASVPANPEPARDGRPRARPAWWLTASAVMDVRTLPDWSGGPKLGVLWDLKRAWVWAAASYLAARSAREPDSAFAFQVDLFAGALGGALVWERGPYSLGPAVEVEMGYLRGRGESGNVAVAPKATGGLWASALVGAVAAYDPYERFGVQLGLYAGGRLRPLHFALRTEGEPDQPLFSPGAICLRASLGLRVALGAR